MADKVSKPVSWTGGPGTQQPAAPLEVSMDKEASSPLPASSTDGKNQQPPPPLTVVVVVDVDAELSPPSSPASSMDKKQKPPVVVLVCLCMWALLNAVILAGNAIAELIMNRNPCTTSTWFSRCVELTDAAAAEAAALWRGELWCAAPQAAAAALALVLVARGWSLSGAGALAFVALVATGVNHYTEGRVDRIFLAAAPGDSYIAFDAAMSWVLAVVDLICFVCLDILILAGF